MRLAGLPPAERMAHGTRGRYVTGCRCGPCRESNRVYYHQRKALLLEAAAELPPAASRDCPGVNGAPCPARSRLRRDSKGGCCLRCRKQLGDQLVDAAPARAHLFALSAAGVGKRAVAAACDVPRSQLAKLKSGARTKIRRSTLRRILSVDASAVSDHGMVDAAETWRLLNQLLQLGFTKQQVARRLGSVAKTPSLQVKRDQVLAKTAQRVAKVHREMTLELKRDLDLRDELAAAGDMGREWFDAEGYSVIQRKGRRPSTSDAAGAEATP